MSMILGLRAYAACERRYGFCSARRWCLGFALALLGGLSAWAQVPQPPEIAARAYMLLDVTAGQVLAGQDIDAQVEPASLTKLMTAYLVFDALRTKKLNLAQTLPVSERAWKMPGSRMFIDPTMQVPVEDLLKGMIVQSGNDATIALAEGVGGSVEHFVQMMNDQAKVLGLIATQYKNPEGLTEPGHFTTAQDLSLLATRLIQDFPEYIGTYAIKQYRYPGTPAANDRNRNLLLWRDPTVDGLKTGHTDAAGYCLIATARREVASLGTPAAAAGTPGSMGGRRLLAVVLGTASEAARANEAQKLLNWGFTAFDAVKLFEADQPVQTAPIWKGRGAHVKLGRHQPIVVAVPAGSVAKLQTKVLRPEPLVAPLTKGQAVGTLRVSNGEQTVMDVPLTVLEGVEQAGVLGRAWDALRLWIR